MSKPVELSTELFSGGRWENDFEHASRKHSAPYDHNDSLQNIEWPNGKRRIIVIGGIGVGKSSIVNVLLNHGVTHGDMHNPALTAHYSKVANTTHAITLYPLLRPGEQ